jgi:hypothetical protein
VLSSIIVMKQQQQQQQASCYDNLSRHGVIVSKIHVSTIACVPACVLLQPLWCLALHFWRRAACQASSAEAEQQQEQWFI